MGAVMGAGPVEGAEGMRGPTGAPAATQPRHAAAGEHRPEKGRGVRERSQGKGWGQAWPQASSLGS